MRCEMGMVYGVCVGTKGQDTTKLRKATHHVTDKNGDDYDVCEGCLECHFLMDDYNGDCEVVEN